MAIICPAQKTPPSDAPPHGDPEEAKRRRETLFATIWWGFFNALADAMNLANAAIAALQAAMVVVQARLVILEDAVLGWANLTTEGAIPKVSAVDGTLDESAILDDGTTVAISEPVEITGDFDVTGDTTLTGNLEVTGDGLVGGDLDVSAGNIHGLSFECQSNPGITGTVTLAKLTPGGSNGTLTLRGGIVIGHVGPS